MAQYKIRKVNSDINRQYFNEYHVLTLWNGKVPRKLLHYKWILKSRFFHQKLNLISTVSLYFHRFSIKKNALDGHNEDTSLFLCKILFVVHIKVINETFFRREVFPKKEASFPKTTLQVRYNSILRFAIASVTYHLSCFSIRKIIVNSLQIQLYFQLHVSSLSIGNANCNCLD